MKIATIIIFLLGNFVLISQIKDSNYIRPHSNLYVLKNQVVTSTVPKNGGKALLMHFDGFIWKSISNDSIPTFSQTESKCIISKYTNHILLTGYSFVWEYDGKTWFKHFINDSLQGKREYLEIIELPDTSFIITTVSKFVKYTSGNVTVLEKLYHEVLQFKKGTFTTLKSRWTDMNTIVGAYNSFQKLKVQANGNYTYYTPIETAIPDRVWELVTFSPKHEIVKKDTNPDLTLYGFDNEFVEYSDYLYDSKGSLWYITSNKDSRQFVGLVEKRPNGELYFYNDNIGIPKRVNRNFSFDIDDDDNIWFNQTYRYETINGAVYSYPSIFLLKNDKITLKEYKYEELMEKSIWYNGGDTTWTFHHYGEFKLIRFHKDVNSLLLCSDIPMLQFFPEKETTSVNEFNISPIQLYPNPIRNGNFLTIESSVFKGINIDLDIIIRDISGKIVKEEVVSSNGHLLQIYNSGLIPGTYFVSILKNNNLILQTKFIKE